ncbi:OsmC family protein [Anaeromyxobacter sp. Fw109-5]|uniref:OsmC family protein n=1 Tax=Anaeromyxobacter sp. (strain Fw109-5) TaxID=404589 RepID=UPI001305116F|nr:OsmC family protein [Anaeromyxobacter sp. Fw109-5]
MKSRFDGATATLEAGSFKWQADLSAPLGGGNAAPSPTALLLGALAGCAVVFIRETLAPQMGIRVDSVEAEARCDADARGLLGIGGVAADLTDLSLDVRIRSPDGADAVARLSRAWHERCPVYLALVKATPVRTSFEATG